MTNHVHLLLTPKNAATVPKLVISLGRRFVQYINREYRRTGTLWDSGYKSSLIQAGTYLLTCMRYIELNPVRAAFVDDPAHSRWASYRATALRTVLTAPQPSSGLPGIGGDRQRATRSLAQFVPAPSRSEDHHRPTACAEPKPTFGQ